MDTLKIWLALFVALAKSIWNGFSFRPSKILVQKNEETKIVNLEEDVLILRDIKNLDASFEVPEWVRVLKLINIAELTSFTVPKHILALVFQCCPNLEEIKGLTESNLIELHITSRVVLQKDLEPKAEKYAFRKLKQLPALPPTLTVLDVSYTFLESLPQLPEGLKKLHAGGNYVMKTLPALPAGLEELWLDDAVAELPKELPPNIKSLDVRGYFRLPRIPKGLNPFHILPSSIAGNYYNRHPFVPVNLPASLHNKSTFQEIMLAYECVDQWQMDEALAIQKNEATALTVIDKAAGKQARTIGDILKDLGYCTQQHINFAVKVQRYLQETVVAEPIITEPITQVEVGNERTYALVDTEIALVSQTHLWSIAGSLSDNYKKGTNYSIKDFISAVNKWQNSENCQLQVSVFQTYISLGNKDKPSSLEPFWVIERVSGVVNDKLVDSTGKNRDMRVVLAEFLARKFGQKEIYLTLGTKDKKPQILQASN